MRSRSLLAAVLGALLVLLAGWGFFQRQRATAVATELARLRADYTALEKQRDEQIARISRIEEQRPATASAKPAGDRTAGDAGANVSPAVTAGAGSGAGRAPATPRTPPSAVEVLMTFPEYQRLAQEYTRASTGLRFGALYRKLGLSAEQIAAFERVILDQSQTYMDTMASARAEGISASDPRLSELMKPFNEAASARMVAILGEAGALEYGRYNQTTEARTLVEGFASNLYYTSSPLTGAQAEGLTDLIARHTSTVQPMSGLVLAKREIAWEDVLSDASQFLSSEQVSTLKAMRDRTATQQALADFSAEFIRQQGAAAKAP